VSGEDRAVPLLAALRAGVATHLVVDELLARAVLAAGPADEASGDLAED